MAAHSNANKNSAEEVTNCRAFCVISPSMLSKCNRYYIKLTFTRATNLVNWQCRRHANRSAVRER